MCWEHWDFRSCFDTESLQNESKVWRTRDDEGSGRQTASKKHQSAEQENFYWVIVIER